MDTDMEISDAYDEMHFESNDQLLEMLQQNWSDYINHTTIKDKHHSLQLFLFNFRLVDENLLNNENFKSFFKFIPEEICSYLLKQTYNIINTGDLYANCVFHADDIQVNSCKFMQTQQQQTEQQILSADLQYLPNQQEKLLAANDHNKIVALREYFTLGLGHHLLDFLLRIDIKLVTSLKNLCNLCYNIFPNCRWQDSDQPTILLQPLYNIYDCIGNFYIYKKIKNCKQEKQQRLKQQQPTQQEKQLRSNSCRLQFNDESHSHTYESDGQMNAAKWQPLAIHDNLINYHFVRKLNNLYKSQQQQQQHHRPPQLINSSHTKHINTVGRSNIWLYIRQLYTRIQQQQQQQQKQQKQKQEHQHQQQPVTYRLQYHQFRNSTKSSDEIALMLIRLLYKCISCTRNDMSAVLDDEHSIHMMALHFALDQLLLQPDVFSIPANTNRIKMELLKLIEQCLNNVFHALYRNIETNNSQIHFQAIFQKFYYALNATTDHSNLQHAILYIIFNTLYNAITLNISISNSNDTKSDLIYTKSFLDETILNSCSNAIDLLVKRPKLFSHIDQIKADVRNYDKDPDKDINESSDNSNDDSNHNKYIIDINDDADLTGFAETDHSEDDLHLLFVNIHQTIMRIILQLHRYHQTVILRNNNTSNLPSNGHQLKPVHYRKIKNYQIHCITQVPHLSCQLQQLILNLFHIMPIYLQEEIIVYFIKFGACCCQYNITLYSQCLNAALRLPLNIQKNIYKFLCYQILHNMYLHSTYYRPMSARLQKHQLSRHRLLKYDSRNCSKCLEKFQNHAAFFSELLQVYCDFHQKLQNCKTLDDTSNLNDIRSSTHLLSSTNEIFILFIKHLKHIIHYLDTDLAKGILTQILLPIFYNEKLQLKEFNQTSDTRVISPDDEQSTDKAIENKMYSAVNGCYQQQLPPKISLDNIKLCLNECLQTLALYVCDVQLIKIFYTEENIKHLEELLEEPELFRGVCELIKTGIENINCLGETDIDTVEHDLLSCRFINLQLNSSARASQLFHNLLAHLIQQYPQMQTSEANLFWLESDQLTLPFNTTATSKLFYSSSFNVDDILYFVTLQWSLNVELLKTSQYFHNEFSRMYSIAVEDGNDDDNSYISTKIQTSDTKITPQLRKDPARQQKTILEILRLNYNALVAYLLPPPNLPSNKVKFENSHTEMISEDNLYNHDNAPYSLIDPYIYHISTEEYIHLLDSPIATLSQTSNLLEMAKDKWSSLNQSTFLENFHQSDQKQSVLYDIKNQYKYPDRLDKIPEQQSIEHLISECYTKPAKNIATNGDYTNDLDFHKGFQNQQDTILTNDSGSSRTEEQGYLISKLFRSLGNLFSREIVSPDSTNCPTNTSKQHPTKGKDTTYHDCNLQFSKKFYQFYEIPSKGKKLLLKLFEATLSVGIKSYQNITDDMLEKHLHKLKAAILENVNRKWSQRCDNYQAYQNLIIQLLRTLLQMAELTNIDNQKTGDTSTGTLSTPFSEEDSKRLGMSCQRQMSLTPPPLTSSTYAPCRIPTISGTYHDFQPNNNLNNLVNSKFGQSTKPNGTKVFSEYLAKCTAEICNGGSDLEASDNDLDNFYITANEDYDADIEIAEFSENNDDHELNSDVGNISHSYQISHYRTNILHDGICRMVIEILIELSKKCCQDPGSGWSDGLVQLLNRLFIIRKNLGSPTFLLKGFTSILQCSDVRLRDLQQAFLELITDLTTADNLNLFFSMLAAKNPPVDILIKHINHIVVNTLKIPQPSAEIEFPIYIQESAISDLNYPAFREFYKLRSCQFKRQIHTPITRSPCCMPIGDDRSLYHTDGFTISIWLQIKDIKHNFKYSSQCLTINDDTYGSRDQFSKTHILSVGSTQAMLSIYITNSCHLQFEISKPTATLSSNTNISNTANTSTSNYHTASGNISGDEANNRLCLNTTINSNNDSVTSSIRKAFKHTNQALYTSLTTMHLFPGFGGTKNNYDSTSLELSQHHILKNKWTHFIFAVQVNTDSLRIHTYTDSFEQRDVQLKFANIRALNRNCNSPEMLLLGDGIITNQSLPNNSLVTNHSEFTPTMDCVSYRLGISTVMVFDRCFIENDIICNLTAMGPDFIDLTICLIGNWKPNYGYLNLIQTHKRNFGNYIECLRMLQEAQILCYSAQHPNSVMNKDTKNKSKDNSSTSNKLLNNRFLLYGELTRNQLASLQTATIQSGGLANLLYLFARVVEISGNSATQSMALNLLLKIALSENRLYTEFLCNDYLILIGYVIKSDRCTKDCQLLKSIVNNACSQPVINRKGDQLTVNENTTAIIIYPRLLTFVLQRYSDWHRSGCQNSQVLDMLLTVILSLTRDKHPKRDFNIAQLNTVQLMRKLFNLCKVHIIESPNPIYISSRTADSFADIVAIFAGSPASSMLDEIMKLLLLLHKPSDCYITDDRRKLYFLITPSLPPQQNSFKSLLPGLNLTTITTTTTTATTKTLPYTENDYQQNDSIQKKTLWNSVKFLSKPEFTVDVNTANDMKDLTVDQKSNQRLRRKRRSLNNKYKQLQQEFEENMASIVANSTKLNRNIFHLLNPEKIRNWREKYKRITNTTSYNRSPQQLHKVCKTQAMYNSMGHSARLVKKQRIQGNCMEFKGGIPNLMTATAQNCRIANKKKQGGKASVRPLRLMINNSNSSTGEPDKIQQTIVKPDVYTTAGLIALQIRLLQLLTDFVCLMPDYAIDDVLHHYVKVEFLLVLANNVSCSVRTAIIKLLNCLINRLYAQDVQNCYKNLYHYHLANQLILHDVNEELFAACLKWVSGQLYSTNALNLDWHIENQFALNALLSIASKSTYSTEENLPNSSQAFSEKSFLILKKLFTASMDCSIVMVEAGLLQCCCKALYNIYVSKNICDHKTGESAIIELLISVGEFSLKSFGYMNIIWDLNNLFAFFQLKQSLAIVQGFRSTQAKLLLSWNQMFFTKSTLSSGDFKVAQFNDCTLSTSEIHTRLDLLIRHSTQYFTIYNNSKNNSNASENEINLFKFLISYNVATKQRCNSFIAWGLKPSRPLELRAFVIDVMWQASRDEFISTFISDGKILIKSLLWLNLIENKDAPIHHLPELCQHFGIKENDTNWNLENDIHNLKLHNDHETHKQKTFLEKTVYRFENLVQSCIESAMSTTRKVAEIQNSERKLLMSHMKDYDDSQAYAKWLDIVRRLTHECAPWHSPHNAKNYWELDATEGPSRIHNRLRRCHLKLDKRFFLNTYNNDIEDENDIKFNYTDNSLDYLIGHYRQQLNIPLNAQILHNFPAKYLPVDGEINGEIILTEQDFYFIATYHCKHFYLNFHLGNIVEIWQKRYQQQEKAFEIFFDTSQSLFFVLLNQNDWRILRDVFFDKIIVTPDTNKLMSICQQWRDGQITNWEYLMALNQMAGRTYNDLMQYPIFPWILANYASDTLDLGDYRNYRNLAKPIAIQNSENEAHYISNYNYIKDSMTNISPIILQPYHYSSHYSNSGTVLHFLVRLPPFTSYFLRYQDNNFDIPDRTFHNLNTTWQLASRDSPTDVKELIPEFFCLPEMFENFNHLNFGVRQNGEPVEDVILPDWCQRDPRLFVLVHRQALESDYVRSHLHNWIDLIFGYKQIGQAAIDAINVFHPATYFIFLETEILDPIERNAVLTMVKTYGQMPRQLFKTPHLQAKPLPDAKQNAKPVLVSVQGLQWGVYVGSPQLSPPNIIHIYKLPGTEYLLSFNNTNVVYGFTAHARVMQGPDTDTYNMITWNYDDRIVRLQPFNNVNSKTKNLFHNNQSEISACGCDPNSNQLWFGYKSGYINIYKCTNSDSRQIENKRRQSYVNTLRSSYNSAVRKITNSTSTPDTDIDMISMSSNLSFYATDSKFSIQHEGIGDVQWHGPTILMGHKTEITCIQLSVEFKAAVTADRDGVAIIWDLNDWSYVRTIERPSEIHHSPISLLSISPTLGDIVTVHSLYNGNSNTEHNEENTMPTTPDALIADECFEVTEENLDDFINVSINPNGKSMLRLHSINAHYVKHIVHEDRILAICFSRIKEGVGVNVIATAVENGIIRLWSTWNLNYITEIVTGALEIKSITYSMYQHLIVLTNDGEIQVWESEGLPGNAPKFPQIIYK